MDIEKALDDALVALLKQGPKLRNCGICSNIGAYLVRRPFPDDFDEILRARFEGWEHSTGHYLFPIPGDYRACPDKWDIKDPDYGPYAALRWDLLRYCVKNIRERTS